MQRPPVMLAAVAALSAVALLRPTEARACSCAVGEGWFLAEDGAVLPSNAKGILWWASGWRLTARCVEDHCKDDRFAPVVRSLSSEAAFVVERRTGQRAVPVKHTYEHVEHDDRHLRGYRSSEAVLVQPSEPMKPGERYRFSNTKSPFGRNIEVTIGKEPLEAAVVDLEIGEPELGPLELSAGMSCSTKVEASRRSVRMKLPDQAKKYAGALVFTTLVDGKPWRAAKSFCTPAPIDRSWTGKGTDQIYASCGDVGSAMLLSSDLKSGEPHEVVMKAELPGTDVAITSKAVRVDLLCPPRPAASSPPPAASASRPEVASRGGCGKCVASASTPGDRPWAAALTLAAALVVRRIHRARRARVSAVATTGT